jgi:hypothetical protein
MSQVVFMGHVLSDRGVGPAEVKVKAVVEAPDQRLLQKYTVSWVL